MSSSMNALLSVNMICHHLGRWNTTSRRGCTRMIIRNGLIRYHRVISTSMTTTTHSTPILPSSSLLPVNPINMTFHCTTGYDESSNHRRHWMINWKSWSILTMAGGVIWLSHHTTTNDGRLPHTVCEASHPVVSSVTTTVSDRNVSKFTPASVAKEDITMIVDDHNAVIDQLPIYTADEMAMNDGTNGKPMWMSYGGMIYDVTNFIQNHPGGSDKIIQAAGSAVEPFWYTYRQHYNSDLPMRLMEHMVIGRLHETDQNDIDEQMQLLELDDPYGREPQRHKLLRIHSDTPMSAEVPTKVLHEHYITPNDLFYIRHHHPVPYLTDKQIRDYKLYIDLSEYNAQLGVVSFTMEEIQQMPQTELIVTLQCSGNRRVGYNTYQRTSGIPWGQGAISTAKFTGVRLRDLLIAAGVTDPIAAQQNVGMEHIQFFGRDGMSASIDIEKATSPYGDCIVAYKMNDEPIPRDHGFPLRVIVPGYAAVRHVKWLDRIVISASEADGVWQRGLSYKILPPNVTDASTIDMKDMPSVTELSVYSGITNIDRIPSNNNSSINPGDRIVVKVSGWAYAGGGRNVIRVDVTGDNGTTWTSAELREGSKQRFRHAWAWTFWECDVPAVVGEDGAIHVASKAVDHAFNVQPESNAHMWNVRGLGNNSWYRAHARVL